MAQRPPGRSGDWLRLLAPLLVYAALFYVAWELGYFDRQDRAAALDRARAHGAHWFEIIFLLVYAGLATFALPLSPLAYGAGAMFGVARACALVWGGSMIGAIAGYWLARTVFARSAQRLLRGREARLQRLGGGSPFLTVLRLQVLPVLPFGVLNYAAALAHIPLRPFLLGTALGIVPGTLLAATVGTAVSEGLRGGGAGQWMLAAGAAVVTILLSFVPGLWKRGPRA